MCDNYRNLHSRRQKTVVWFNPHACPSCPLCPPCLPCPPCPPNSSMSSMLQRPPFPLPGDVAPPRHPPAPLLRDSPPAPGKTQTLRDRRPGTTGSPSHLVPDRHQQAPLENVQDLHIHPPRLLLPRRFAPAPFLPAHPLERFAERVEVERREPMSSVDSKGWSV